MANLEKLKRRNRLGAPPSASEASTNIHAPEVAPASPESEGDDDRLRLVSPPAEGDLQPTTPMSSPSANVPRGTAAPRTSAKRGGLIDGRTLRRTGRTVAFATRVSESFHQRLRRAAERDRLLIVEVLERALDAYERQR